MDCVIHQRDPYVHPTESPAGFFLRSGFRANGALREYTQGLQSGCPKSLFTDVRYGERVRLAEVTQLQPVPTCRLTMAFAGRWFRPEQMRHPARSHS